MSNLTLDLKRGKSGDETVGSFITNHDVPLEPLLSELYKYEYYHNLNKTNMGELSCIDFEHILTIRSIDILEMFATLDYSQSLKPTDFLFRYLDFTYRYKEL